MISRTQLARRTLAANARAQLRAKNTVTKRFNSTTSGSAPNASATSHAVAGVAGGTVVLLGVYGYYRSSGLHTVVTTSQKVAENMQVAKTKLMESTPNPNQAIAYLRNVAKSYSAVIPGAASYVDSAFDGIDKLTETHGDEVNKIVSDAYNEIKAIVSKNKTVDLETAIQVLNVIKTRGAELSKLAADIGSDALGPILDKHPEVKEALGGGWNEFKERAQEAGDKGQDALNEVTKSVQDIFKGGFSPESIAKAKDTIQKKAKELQEIGQEGAKKAWDEAMKKGGPYLDKFPPQIKDTIQNNSSLLMTLGGAGGAGQIWKMIQSGAEKAKDGKVDEETVNKIKDFIEKQVQSAKEKGSKGASSMGLGGVWESAQSFLGEIPDFDETKKDIEQLLKVAQEHGDEAKELAQETNDEIRKILREKLEKAKKLGGDAKEDAKGATDKAKKDGKGAAEETKEKGKKAAKDVKDKAEDKAEEGKEKAKDVKDKAKGKAEDVKDKAKDKAEDVKDKAKEKK